MWQVGTWSAAWNAVLPYQVLRWKWYWVRCKRWKSATFYPKTKQGKTTIIFYGVYFFRVLGWSLRVAKMDLWKCSWDHLLPWNGSSLDFLFGFPLEHAVVRPWAFRLEGWFSWSKMEPCSSHLATVIFCVFFWIKQSFRFKGALSSAELITRVKNIQTCINLSNNFDNFAWHDYLTKQPSSINSIPDSGLNGLLSVKWKSQHPDARFKYKLIKNKSAKRDNIRRIHSLQEVQDYLRRFQNRDSLFNLPIRTIINYFTTWVMDR